MLSPSPVAYTEAKSNPSSGPDEECTTAKLSIRQGRRVTPSENRGVQGIPTTQSVARSLTAHITDGIGYNPHVTRPRTRQSITEAHSGRSPYSGHLFSSSNPAPVPVDGIHSPSHSWAREVDSSHQLYSSGQSCGEGSIPYCSSPWRWRPSFETPVANEAWRHEQPTISGL